MHGLKNHSSEPWSNVNWNHILMHIKQNSGHNNKSRDLKMSLKMVISRIPALWQSWCGCTSPSVCGQRGDSCPCSPSGKGAWMPLCFPLETSQPSGYSVQTSPTNRQSQRAQAQDKWAETLGQMQRSSRCTVRIKHRTWLGICILNLQSIHVKAKGCIHLHSHNDDFQQLQAKFERLAPLCMILVTRAHEEILEFPPQGLLLSFFLLLEELGAHQGRRAGAATSKKILGAITWYGGEQLVLLC